MDFDLTLFIESLPSLLDGAMLTLQLTLISVTLGLITGLVMGLGRVSKRWSLRFLSSLYVTVFRGIPLLVTLMFLYYGMPSLGVLLSAYAVSIIALTVTNGAYVTEIIRSGIQSIDKGQMRAARSLGVGNVTIIRRHVLPNAMTAALTFLPFVLIGSITALTSLDFLGFGLPPGSPSLGELLAQGKSNIQAPWLGITAFLVLAGMLSLLVFVGEAIRDAFDPRKTMQ